MKIMKQIYKEYCDLQYKIILKMLKNRRSRKLILFKWRIWFSHIKYSYIIPALSVTF